MRAEGLVAGDDGEGADGEGGEQGGATFLGPQLAQQQGTGRLDGAAVAAHRGGYGAISAGGTVRWRASDK